MKIAALFLCAGSGDRFFSKIPKQFISLGSKKIYQHALDTLLSSANFSEVSIVIQKKYECFLDPHPGIKVAYGGSTRQESVLKGLQNLNTPDGVMIVEAARPFITKQLIFSHLEKLSEGSMAVNTCIACHDTINVQQNTTILQIPPRDQFLRGQTPQSFQYIPLLNAHLSTNKLFTDDCGLMMDAGHSIEYVNGFDENIKITTPFDLKVAQTILAQGVE